MPKIKVFSFSRKKLLKFKVYYFFKLEIKCSNWLILPMGGGGVRRGSEKLVLLFFMASLSSKFKYM